MSNSDLTAFGRFLAAYPRLWPLVRYTVLPVMAVAVAVYQVITKHLPEFIAGYREEVGNIDERFKALVSSR